MVTGGAERERERKPEQAVERERVVGIVRRGMSETPDFPQPGVLFRDLSGLFADPEGLPTVGAALLTASPDFGRVDAVAGVEARGFVLGTATALAGGLGMLAVRKAGKLPGDVLTETYSLEYGEAALEVHPRILPPGSRVLIVDDVLATGGTLAATIRLVQRAGWEVAGIAVVIELEALGGRAALPAGIPIEPLLLL